MNFHRNRLTLLFLAVGCLASFPAAAIKCWTNKEGVKECGNVVPPEYSQQETTQINKAGIVTGKTERAKTPEEIAQEKAQADQKAAEERVTAEQTAKDRVLLETYNSEDDMVLARDGKIADIGSQIKITQNYIEKLKGDLDARIAQAADLERRGEKPNEKLQADIESVRGQIKKNEDFIVSKKEEQDSVRKQFDADIARYRELKQNAGKVPAPAAAADKTKP
ncbi:MAG TPA: hypothetical protein VMH34_06370 [Gammaproteobacteria bacterium]|nr:hypothetical protein [Gammaproteobacteria bacterium]